MGELLFLSSYFSSKFYIFESGLPQPSHFLILILLIYFLIFNFKAIGDKSLKALFIFVSYVVVVNLIWAIISGSQSYLNSIVFWVFNFLTFSIFISIEKIRFPLFQNIILFSFIIIFLCWLLGVGRYNFNPRYNFFFNDPNQLAFWVLCSLSIYLIKPNKLSLFVILLGFLIVISSMSRSAILGIVLIFLGYTFNFKLNIKSIFFKVISIFILFVSINIIIYNNQDEVSYLIDRFAETDIEDQADIRGYTALGKYPEYLLFGGGQGEYNRFSSTNHEIHSTWAGILFYYGFIGLLLFLIFLWTIWSRLSFYEKIIFLAPLVYGFSTYGLRASIFWFFLATYVMHVKFKNPGNKDI
ncbi:hypothetical protein [Acinetobacter pecorum]|uniref:O-antigen ligase domain-containing protein n=1 Tax=Acinetobacter pecorum TaxID=2762215 RepID=A0ABR8VWV1_9GAMM|nr:hypothetical protein [Acinetobacter pecorum]MBD8009238.1 hypothetical protein [Acinetobacter pecorum]